MTKRFMVLLATLMMSFAFSSLAEDNSSTNYSSLEAGYFSTGVGLGFSNEATFKSFGGVLQYGVMLSEDRSVSTGIVFNITENSSFVFRGNYEHSIPIIEGKILPGIEAFIDLGVVDASTADNSFKTADVDSESPDTVDENTVRQEDEELGLKLGLGFGVGGFVKYLISEKRTTVFKFGLKFIPQDISQLNIEPDNLTAYIGMNLYFHH